MSVRLAEVARRLELDDGCQEGEAQWVGLHRQRRVRLLPLPDGRVCLELEVARELPFSALERRRQSQPAFDEVLFDEPELDALLAVRSAQEQRVRVRVLLSRPEVQERLRLLFARCPGALLGRRHFRLSVEQGDQQTLSAALQHFQALAEACARLDDPALAEPPLAEPKDALHPAHARWERRKTLGAVLPAIALAGYAAGGSMLMLPALGLTGWLLALPVAALLRAGVLRCPVCGAWVALRPLRSGSCARCNARLERVLRGPRSAYPPTFL